MLLDLAKRSIAVVPRECVAAAADLAGLRKHHEPSDLGCRLPKRLGLPDVAVVAMERDQGRITRRWSRCRWYERLEHGSSVGLHLCVARGRAVDDVVKSGQTPQCRQPRSEERRVGKECRS